MKGVILEKGGCSYTHLQGLFHAAKDVQKDYNWLITDCECYPNKDEFEERLFQYGNYGWLSGEELTDMVNEEDFQWVWAVLSGFRKDVTLEQVLEYKLPYADGYTGFWENPISIQHPLAKVEIVAWDSSCTILISENNSIVNDYMREYPCSLDLEKYNEEE